MRWFAVLLLSVALALPTSAANAAERRPGVQSAYLVGLDIHTPSGRVVHVPLKKQKYSWTTLWGRTPQGWLVGYGCDVYLVDDGRATKIPKADVCSLGYGYVNTLTDDRRHLLVSWDERGTGIDLAAIELADPKVDYEFIEEAYDILGGSGDTAYLAKYDGFYSVDLPTGEITRVMKRTVRAVDIATDTIFVWNKKTETFGPTSLSAPGKVAWRQTFLPTGVSPNGTYVVGYDPDYDGPLQVRRMSDGSLVARLPKPQWGDGFVEPDFGWDSERSVVMVTNRGERRALVRCAVPSGDCHRVTPFSRLSLSLPTWVSGPHSGV